LGAFLLRHPISLAHISDGIAITTTILSKGITRHTDTEEKTLTTLKATDALLRPTQLAERWGVSARSLANQRCQGVGVRFIKIGASVRYRLEDVQSFEIARTVEPVSA
jgi:hypothetical protein